MTHVALVSGDKFKSNMATKVVAKTCTGNSRACFNSLKDLIQRLSSTKAPSKADEEIRVSFVTNGCSFEELEQIQDLVSTDLEVHEDFYYSRRRICADGGNRAVPQETSVRVRSLG